jgi:hypothetical protein
MHNGIRGADPEHERRVRELLDKIAKPSWTQKWWGILLLGFGGGALVVFLERLLV